MEKKYYTNYDSALLAYSVLQRFNSGKLDTFDERLRTQKIQYLAQAFGISPQYPYGLYLRGPYSSTLTADLFMLKESHAVPVQDAFVPDELEGRFSKAKSFIENKSNRELELIATYHWLKNSAQFSDERAEQKLKDMKAATDEEVSKTKVETQNI